MRKPLGLSRFLPFTLTEKSRTLTSSPVPKSSDCSINLPIWLYIFFYQGSYSLNNQIFQNVSLLARFLESYLILFCLLPPLFLPLVYQRQLLEKVAHKIFVFIMDLPVRAATENQELLLFFLFLLSRLKE